MKKRGNDNFVTSVLILAIILVFSVTTYFCLDIFEIIEVPERYSLVSFLGSKIEISTVAETLENIIPTEKVNESFEDIEKPEEIEKVEPPDLSKYYNKTSIEGNTSNFTTYQNTKAENQFYYNQLDVYAKLIYDELYRSKEELKTGLHTVDFDITFNDLLHEENGNITLENDFQLAMNALIFDKPDIFYLDITKMYLFTEITTFGPKKTYRVSIGPNNQTSYLAYPYTDKNSVNLAINQIEEIVNNITNENESEYEKIRMVHDFIVENVEYDSTISASNIYNIYGTLVNKVAVCEGYAKTFKYVMDKYEIPCIIVCGVGRNSNGNTESHAWNYIKIKDNWYAIDVTWDDPVIIGGGSPTYGMRYHYFLKGKNTFFEDHIEDGILVGEYRFTYPMLSENSYKK